MQTAMTITDQQMQSIGKYVKSHFAEWLSETMPMRPQYEPALLERMVRVEEELKHQRELMIKGFERMDQRFEAMQTQMNLRFDAVDKRFESIQEQSNLRFEAVDKRFETIQQQMDKRFDALTSRIDRFMVWSFATTVSVSGVIIAVIKFT